MMLDIQYIHMYESRVGKLQQAPSFNEMSHGPNISPSKLPIQKPFKVLPLSSFLTVMRYPREFTNFLSHPAFFFHCLNGDSCSPFALRTGNAQLWVALGFISQHGCSSSKAYNYPTEAELPQVLESAASCLNLKDAVFITESEPLEIHADKGIFKGSEKTCREEPVHRAFFCSPTFYSVLKLPSPLSSIFLSQLYRVCWLFPGNNSVESNQIFSPKQCVS